MKPRTDLMNDEELLEYVIRLQWKDRALQSGAGLVAGSAAAYFLGFPEISCTVAAGVGGLLAVTGAALHFSEPEFVPTQIDDEASMADLDDWVYGMGKYEDDYDRESISPP